MIFAPSPNSASVPEFLTGWPASLQRDSQVLLSAIRRVCGWLLLCGRSRIVWLQPDTFCLRIAGAPAHSTVSCQRLRAAEEVLSSEILRASQKPHVVFEDH